MTRVAICGVGKIGKVHIENLLTLRGCKITGLYDTDRPELERVSSRYGIGAFDSAEQLLADEATQAVVIATPSSSHKEWCQRALPAGKHVFVEKPLAGTLADAAAIVETARSHPLVVQVGFCERFNPQYLEARRAVCSGALGAVRVIHSSRVAPYALSDPGWDLGVLDTAVHNLDLILWLMGHTPDKVLTRAVQVYAETSIPHSAIILLTFSDGAIAVDHISWLQDAAHPLNRCARSRMFVQGAQGAFQVDLTDRPSSLLTADFYRKIDSVVIGGPEYYGCLKLQFEYFLKSIEEGAPVLAGPEEAYQAERVVLAALASLRSGREVALEEIA